MVISHNFPKALTRISPRLFSVQCSHNQYLVLPEELVFREKLANTQDPSPENPDLPNVTKKETIEEENVGLRADIDEISSVLEESINLSDQQEALEAFRKEKKAQYIRRKAQREQEQARASVLFQQQEQERNQVQEHHLQPKRRVSHSYDFIPSSFFLNRSKLVLV